MFATIKTTGATHIAIYVPHEGAEKTLPALAALLEQNAVFIMKSYQEIKTVKPEMGIVLGDEFRAEEYGVEVMVTVPERSAVINPDFKPAAPEVFTSNAAALKKKDDELGKLRTELSFVKSQLDNANAALASLREEQDRTLAA